MKTRSFIALVCALAISQVLAQDTCKCRTIQPEDPCSFVVSDGAGTDTCSVKNTGCSGCVCDLDGLLECDLANETSFVFTSGNKCGRAPSVRTVCPASTATPTPSPAPFRQQITSSCTVSGPLSWADRPCDVLCFPPSYGALTEVLVEFNPEFIGSLTVSTPVRLSGIIRVGIGMRVSVDHEGFVLFNDAGRDYTVVPTTDNFVSFGMAAGAESTLSNITGTLDLSNSNPGDGLAAYMCSGGVTTTSFNVDGQVETTIENTPKVTSKGSASASVTVTYTFFSSESLGTPVP